jgi:hypothetical protein
MCSAVVAVCPLVVREVVPLSSGDARFELHGWALLFIFVDESMGLVYCEFAIVYRNLEISLENL